MKTTLSIISLLMGLPAVVISLYITYELLLAIEADRLLWFLYWVYVPTTIIFMFLSKLVSELKDK